MKKAKIIFLDRILQNNVSTGENNFVIHAESVQLNNSHSVCKI